MAGFLTAAVLAGSAVPLRAASPVAAPMALGGAENITLYGNAALGWGLNSTNLTNPGPHLHVYYGDTVVLTLIATDGNPHTWFLSYDGALSPSGGEPLSPQFTSQNSIVWNFTADHLGTFSYHCGVHPTTMEGVITIGPKPVAFTLYGNAALGWGLSATNLTNPGPTLVVSYGANVTLHLLSTDGNPHTWFVSYDGALSPSSGEPLSPQFTSQSPVNYTFLADRAGNYTYRCSVHPTTMTGRISIVGAPPAPAARPGLGLIPSIMVGLIIGVLVLAGVYQVRASRAYRRNK